MKFICIVLYLVEIEAEAEAQAVANVIMRCAGKTVNRRTIRVGSMRLKWIDQGVNADEMNEK